MTLQNASVEIITKEQLADAAIVIFHLDRDFDLSQYEYMTRHAEDAVKSCGCNARVMLTNGLHRVEVKSLEDGDK